MAKSKSQFEQLVDYHLAQIERQSLPSKAFGLGLPSWLKIPEWVLALAIAQVLSAVKNIAKSEAGKAAMKAVFLRLWLGIQSAYSDDADFDCSN